VQLLEEAHDLLEDAVALRRRLHRRPEIGLDLPETQAAVLEALDGTGTEITLGEGCTSVVAVLEGAHPGPTVLLRGDMDALPMTEATGLEFASEVDGAMHACGHDTHTAMLAAAARMLASHRDRLHGRVLFMFQPGEEGHFGARVMLEEGLLDVAPPVAGAFAIHITSHERSGVISSKAGTIAASADTLHIRLAGRGGHASAPALALDPIPAACETVLALQTMVTRRIRVFDPAVVTIARIEAGTTDNVIPETAELEGTVRSLTPRTRSYVLQEARRVAEGVAAAHGISAEVVVEDGYPPTVNDDDMARFALDTARELLADAGDDLVETRRDPVMGAEDFSYVLERVPGAMVRLGMAPPGVEYAPGNHSNRMVVDESAMATGIAFHAAVALNFLDGTPRD
jgi:hippurate hydrolase